jgi:hypothetical protein
MSITRKIIFPELPYYLKVYEHIDIRNNTVKVYMHSLIHENKVVIIPNSWTWDYRRDKANTFKSEVRSFIIKRYRLCNQPTKFI